MLNDLGVHFFKAFNLQLAPWEPMKEDPLLSFGLKTEKRVRGLSFRNLWSYCGVIVVDSVDDLSHWASDCGRDPAVLTCPYKCWRELSRLLHYLEEQGHEVCHGLCSFHGRIILN